MVHLLHLHSSRQPVTEIHISHLVFSKLFLRTCASESSGEFEVLMKCLFLHYGGFFLLCNCFNVVALISGFPPLPLRHVFRKQPVHYDGDQMTENQQQVKTVHKKW